MQREDISRYMAKEESGDSTYTLGSVLKSKNDADEGNTAADTN